MTAIATSYESLLKVREGAVDIVDVPEFGFVAVTGTGEPGGAEFTEAVQALYSVSYGARFRLKKLTGQAPRVMPLEGLWWVDDPARQDIGAAVARGEVTLAGSDRGSWRWQALIMQPDPVDAELIAAATAEAARRKDLPGLARLEYIRCPGRRHHRHSRPLRTLADLSEPPDLLRVAFGDVVHDDCGRSIGGAW